MDESQSPAQQRAQAQLAKRLVFLQGLGFTSSGKPTDVLQPAEAIYRLQEALDEVCPALVAVESELREVTTQRRLSRPEVDEIDKSQVANDVVEEIFDPRLSECRAAVAGLGREETLLVLALGRAVVLHGASRLPPTLVPTELLQALGRDELDVFTTESIAALSVHAVDAVGRCAYSAYECGGFDRFGDPVAPPSAAARARATKAVRAMATVRLAFEQLQRDRADPHVLPRLEDLLAAVGDKTWTFTKGWDEAGEELIAVEVHTPGESTRPVRRAWIGAGSTWDGVRIPRDGEWTKEVGFDVMSSLGLFPGPALHLGYESNGEKAPFAKAVDAIASRLEGSRVARVSISGEKLAHWIASCEPAWDKRSFAVASKLPEVSLVRIATTDPTLPPAGAGEQTF